MNLEIIVPTITFQDTLTIVRGDKVMRVLHVGGHTPATSMMWLPAERVLFAGDIVWIDQHPFMTQAQFRGMAGGAAILSATWHRAYIVPGHGPICDVSTLDRLSEYLRFLRQRTLDLYQRRAHQAGNGQPAHPGTETLVPHSARTLSQNRIADPFRHRAGVR